MSGPGSRGAAGVSRRGGGGVSGLGCLVEEVLTGGCALTRAGAAV